MMKEVILMEANQFNDLFKQFRNASVDKKVDIYCYTEGLTQEQYMQMLRAFPPSQLVKLERALS